MCRLCHDLCRPPLGCGGFLRCQVGQIDLGRLDRGVPEDLLQIVDRAAGARVVHREPVPQVIEIGPGRVLETRRADHQRQLDDQRAKAAEAGEAAPGQRDPSQGAGPLAT